MSKLTPTTIEQVIAYECPHCKELSEDAKEALSHCNEDFEIKAFKDPSDSFLYRTFERAVNDIDLKGLKVISVSLLGRIE